MKRLFDLSERCAILTGATGGLGRTIALGLADAGADLVVVGRNANRLAECRAEVAGVGARVLAIQSDLTKLGEAEQVIAKAQETFGRIDILVNNAGSYLEERVDHISDANWTALFDTNVGSVMRLTRSAAPHMQARRWGRIINISSVLGIASRAGCGTYSATKAAIIGLTKTTALELGPLGITVNCVAPGAFNAVTPNAPPSPRQQANFGRATALGRWGKPDELLGPLLMLASDAGSYVTGAVLVVDGGALARTLY